MPTIYVMTGLPGAGKTTFALALMAAAGGKIRRVNLDSLRLMLDGNHGGNLLSAAHEETVLKVQDAATLAAINFGFNVVLDNTHLVPDIPDRLRRVVRGAATFQVHDLTCVSVAECIRRDADRGQPVGEVAIRRMYEQHLSARATGWRLTSAWMNRAV